MGQTIVYSLYSIGKEHVEVLATILELRNYIIEWYYVTIIYEGFSVCCTLHMKFSFIWLLYHHKFLIRVRIFHYNRRIIHSNIAERLSDWFSTEPTVFDQFNKSWRFYLKINLIITRICHIQGSDHCIFIKILGRSNSEFIRIWNRVHTRSLPHHYLQSFT